jgi:hypothetical protein
LLDVHVRLGGGTHERKRILTRLAQRKTAYRAI